MTCDISVYHADVAARLAVEPDASFDALLCDPPYGFRFMGKSWDYDVPSVDVWRECWRVLKPGAPLLAFGGPRTFHRLAVGIEDAGFDIRDCLMFLFGCLDAESLAVTANGHKRFDQLAIGDPVLAYDPSNKTFGWEPIQDVFIYNIDDFVVRLTTHLGEQLVSRNHRCIVERGGVDSFIFAEEAARQQEARIPVLEDLQGLLATIPMPQWGASEAQQDVRRSVSHCDSDRPATADAKTTKHRMHDLWSTTPQGAIASSRSNITDVLIQVQRCTPRAGVGAARTQGPWGLDCSKPAIVSGEDDRTAESGVEGRRDIQARQGELHRSEVCQVPAGVHADGSQRRLRDGASTCDRDGHRSISNEDRDSSSRKPRHAGQQSGESDAICHESRSQAFRGWQGRRSVMATFKHERYRGVVWCIRVRTGAFVAIRNGFAFPTGNSGFPKSQNVGLAIDNAAGMKRDPIGVGHRKATGRMAQGEGGYAFAEDYPVTAPATPLAKQWDGYGSSMKPSYEPIILARKPLDGTMAENVTAHGVGGLNIDGCRLDGLSEYTQDEWTKKNASRTTGTAYGKHKPSDTELPVGRWPANLILDEHAAEMVDEQSGDRPGMSGGGQHSDDYAGGMSGSIDCTTTARNDRGGASRFFYVSKVSRFEREFGCDELPIRSSGDVNGRDEDSAGAQHARAGAAGQGGVRCHHPTLKSISLTQWLATLILPPPRDTPRRLLVPFAGAGSEVIGAMRAGWDHITAIEREADYVEIMRARIARWREVPAHMSPEDVRASADRSVDNGQESLF